MFSTLSSINEVAIYLMDEGQKKLCYNLPLSDETQTFEVSNNYFVASLGTKQKYF